MNTDVLMSTVSAFKAAVASQQRVVEAQARAAASADRNLGNLLSALRATVTAATGKPLRPCVFWATTGCRYGKSCGYLSLEGIRKPKKPNDKQRARSSQDLQRLSR